jgi:cell division septal protein FtsQ
MAARRDKKRILYAKKKVPKGTTARRGALVFSGILLGGVLIVGVLFALGYIGSFFFSRNPHFQIKTVDVSIESANRLTPAELKDYVQVGPGTNLFQVDINTLRAALESVPVVESVSIERRLPDTLIVKVFERVPVVQVEWTLREDPFLVDRHGVVLYQPRGTSSLPLIEGMTFARPAPGHVFENEGVLFVLQILSERDVILAEYDQALISYRKQYGEGAVDRREYSDVLVDRSWFDEVIRFKSFDLREPDHITAILSSGTSVRLPRHSARARLFRLASLLEKARDTGQTHTAIDLTPDGPNASAI